MTKNIISVGLVLILLSGSIGPASFAQDAGNRILNPKTIQALLEPESEGISFEKNLGQWDPQVLYRIHANGENAFITTRGLVSILQSFPDGSSSEPVASEPPLQGRDGVAVLLRFDGADPDATPTASGPQSRTSNYFLGNDEAQWITSVPHFDRIAIQGLYEGIDLVYYGDHGSLKYDLVVHPGADPGQIQMRFEGQDRARLQDGALLLETPLGSLRHDAPYSYQPEVLEEVTSRYVFQEDTVRFSLGAYDPTMPLVIDPLVYSTHLGGSGDEEGFGGFNVDAGGHAYAIGRTSSEDFPTTPGAFQTSKVAGFDAQITKFSPSGSEIMYSTYIGGGNLDHGYAIVPDAAGNAYAVIYTKSLDAPTTESAYDRSRSGTSDALMVKLDPTGSALLYATYLGGSGDDWGLGLDVDGAGNAYVTGHTRSTDFPTTSSAYQTNKENGDDVFVTKLDASGSSLLYSTLLGGKSNEFAHSVRVESGSAYVAGRTGSSDFPTTSGAFSTSHAGIEDAFVTKLNPAGSALVYSTFLGGSGTEIHAGMDVHGGSAIVSGNTDSTDFPITPQAFQTGSGGGSDAYVVKLSPSGSSLQYATYVGGSGHEEWIQVAVNDAGEAYITGHTESTNFPTTPDAHQPANAGGSDAFMSLLDPSGSRLAYSTYLGGSNDEHGRGGIAVDAGGKIYINGYTSSTDFPTTPGAYQTTSGGLWDAYVAGFQISQTAKTFLSSPGCQLVPCDEHTLGFTQDVADPNGRPTFTLDFGDFDHHADLSCASDCSFWMKFDLAAAAVTPGADGHAGTTPAARLERWDGSTWNAIPGATVDLELTYDADASAYQVAFVEEFLFGVEAFEGASSITYRLVPEPLPWDATQTWSVNLAEAQGQLVAPPVLLVHGWTKSVSPTSVQPSWQDQLEDHLRHDAVVRHGQDPWAWSAPNSGASDGIVGFLYDNKKDFRRASDDMIQQLAVAIDGDAVQFDGPVDIIAHSMGGLVSRYFIETYLPALGVSPETHVGKLVTLGTPHLGAKLADPYLIFIDQNLHHVIPDSDHHYKAKGDESDVGRYVFEQFVGWRNWWDPALEPIDHQDLTSRMADFELKSTANPILKGMNREIGAPGVEYLFIAGYTYKSEYYGGSPGDQTVSVHSATAGRDPTQCFRVENLAPHRGHNDLPQTTSVRADIRSFLAGTGDSLCQTPQDADRPSLLDQIFRWATRKVVSPLAAPSTSAPSTHVEVASFQWDLQGHDGIAFQVMGADGALDALDLELVAPDGTTSRWSSNGTLNATWHPRVDGWVDSLAVEAHSTLGGNWTLRALGPESFEGTLAAIPSLVTDVRMDDLTEDVVPSSEQTVFRIRLTDGGGAVTNALVEVQVQDETGPEGSTVALLDDGQGADEVAGDGTYTGTWTESREGSFLYEATATWPGHTRQASGEVAIVHPTADTPAGVCGSPTTLHYILLEPVFTLKLDLLQDCLERVLAPVAP